MRKLVAVLSAGICLAFVGCSKGQSENCKKLIACSEALNPGTGAAMETSYGPKGACWKDSTSADACSKACDSAMASLKAMPNFATIAACK